MSANQQEYEGPHHPLYCYDIGELGYHRDGSLSCPHSRVKPGPGLQMVLDYVVALLIVELASAEGFQPGKTKEAKPL